MELKFVILLSLFILGQVLDVKCDEEDEEASVEVEEDGENVESDCGCAGSSRKTDDSSKEALADAPKAKTNDEKPKVSAAEAKSNYPRTNQMTYIPQGSFQMGSNNPIIIPDGEGPARKVSLSGFWMDIHEVSNAEFELFVNSTGYVTEVIIFKMHI